MVKRVELVTSASCEDLEKDGYGTKTLKGDADIAKADKKCGTSATIAPKKDGTPVTGASTCDFKKCPSEDQRCLGKGSTATCLACKDIAPGVANIPVSEESCKALKLPTTYKKVGGKDAPVVNYCSLTHDTDALFVSPAWTAAKNTFLMTNPVGLSITAITALMPSQTTAQKEDIQRVIKGACGSVTIDCSTITKCEDYDEPKFETKFTGTKLDNLQEGTVVTGTVSIHSICKENPCAVTKGGKVTTNCLVDDSDLIATDCHTSEGTLVGAADGCAGMKCSEGANQCIIDAAGNPVCASCGNIVDDNTLGKDGSIIVPYQALCDKFDTPTMNCEFTKESALTSNALNSYGSCAEVYLDCSKINKCGNYDNVEADNDTKWGKVELEDTNTFKTKPLLKKFCEENPCAKQIGHACEYDGGSDCEKP